MKRPTDKYSSIELIENGASILNNYFGTEETYSELMKCNYTPSGSIWKCTKIDIYAESVIFHYLYPGTTVTNKRYLYYKDIDEAIRNVKINNLVNGK